MLSGSLPAALPSLALPACNQDLASTYRIQVVGCMKRYICCGALPQLSGSCDPYLCLDVGRTRCATPAQSVLVHTQHLLQQACGPGESQPCSPWQVLLAVAGAAAMLCSSWLSSRRHWAGRGLGWSWSWSCARGAGIGCVLGNVGGVVVSQAANVAAACRRLRTRFIEATHNPVWNERHEVYLADEADTIKLWVKVGGARAGGSRSTAGVRFELAEASHWVVQQRWTLPVLSTDTHLSSLLIPPPSCVLLVMCQDADVVGADFLGQALIEVASITDGQVHDLWLDLTDATGAPMQGKDLTG